LRTANCFGIVAVLLVKGITAFVEGINLASQTRHSCGIADASAAMANIPLFGTLTLGSLTVGDNLWTSDWRSARSAAASPWMAHALG
jgi:hypothetical protein